MGESRYPEQERRREMLHLIHKWTEAQLEARPILREQEFIKLMGMASKNPKNHIGDKVYQQLKAGHKNRFMRLVNEGYVDAQHHSEIYGSQSFTIAWIKGLSESGLKVIEELPDPQAELLARLDSITDAIRTLNDADAPPGQKRIAEERFKQDHDANGKG